MYAQDSDLLNLFHLEKYHFHEVGDPVLLSVKLTLSGALPEVGDAEKAATGAFTPFETVI